MRRPARNEINWHYSKIPKLVLATKKHQKSAKKYPTKSNPCSLTHAVLKNGSFNLPDSNVPKGPAYNETYQHYPKILKLVLATEKHQKLAKKSTESKKNINRATPAVMRNRSSNLAD